jgi:hypothetical protein
MDGLDRALINSCKAGFRFDALRRSGGPRRQRRATVIARIKACCNAVCSPLGPMYHAAQMAAP